MEGWSGKEIGEYIAFGTAVFYAFFKIFQHMYGILKPIFTKKTKEDKASVTVNVGGATQCGNPPFTNSAFPKEDYRYFFYFLLEQGKILKAMSDMRSDILREQMDYYTRHMQTLKMAVTNVMIDLLREAGIDDDNYSTYFSNFENFAEVCESKNMMIFRQMCKDNHFSEYSSLEFRELINRNTTIMVGTMGELLRKRYPQKEYIKNFDRIYKLKTVFQTSLRDCFEYARETAIEREQKVNTAKECFEQQVSDTIGMKYKLEI